MFDRIDAFVRDVGGVASEDELAGLLQEICGEMGFDYFALTLGHAPPPLTANGLDICDGHPAEMKAEENSQARFSRLGACWRVG
ncbi:MAG: hypothetical protein LOX97_04745 [Sphingomonas sp.]|nr:hypothetical protein [Sphingomonas sp.]